MLKSMGSQLFRAGVDSKLGQGVSARVCAALALGLLLNAWSGKTIAEAGDKGFQWRASWIGSGTDGTTDPGAASAAKGMPIFRREFALHKGLSKATLRVSGLGQFETHVNGRKVTDAVLTPGWTDYRKHVLYDTYDVTSLLHTGNNAIGVMLGNGMYNVVETKGRYTKFAGTFGAPKLIAELELRYADGSHETIASDQVWKTTAGPITYTSIYGGEDYDARLEAKGWDAPGFDDNGWSSAAVVAGPGGVLIPENIPPVKEFESFAPIKVTHPEPGVAVYDLGQNFAGWPEIAVSGSRGAAVKLIAGELLDEKKRVSQKSANAYPDSQNEFNYVLRGGGVERWSPRFSYSGFRYVEVRTPEPVKIVQLRGRFLHDAVEVNGHFDTSDSLFNQIHKLINRAMLSNMVSVLTDCPHREKLGWLEQTHLAGPSLMYNYDLDALYAKMADDMQDAQLANGLIPDIAPEYPVFEGGFRDSPEWGAAVVLSPWTAYQFYGDEDILRTHYDSMKWYVGYLESRLQNHLLTFGLGDWYDIGPGDPGESKLTAKGITATAIFYQMLTDMRKIALLLQKTEDAEEFLRTSDEIREAFNAAYFHAGQSFYDQGSQTANAMPLVVGLVPEGKRDAVLASLIADIRKHDSHVTAGDIGFHYVVRALTDGGRSDVLYDMLSRKEKPSYGDQLAHGATALTEAWDANPTSSQNHFMLGHAEEWFYRGLAGIDFDFSREADARIRIAPAFVGKVQRVSGSYVSRMGRIESRWQRSGDDVQMEVVLPQGANATVVFPTEQPAGVEFNGRRLVEGGNIRSLRRENGTTVCVVAGGAYSFRMKLKP
jgi:alpha-L-rhamnosidase